MQKTQWNLISDPSEFWPNVNAKKKVTMSHKTEKVSDVAGVYELFATYFKLFISTAVIKLAIQTSNLIEFTVYTDIRKALLSKLYELGLCILLCWTKFDRIWQSEDNTL